MTRIKCGMLTTLISLINAGFNGKGKTIVIVDAFQDANLVDDLNYFDTFYGLPSSERAGWRA